MQISPYSALLFSIPKDSYAELALFRIRNSRYMQVFGET